ncbi:MAG TPA: hypothetical protein VGK40_06465 [Verrucomicrobiae bacterium]|jgi:hypothetical protein
MKTNDRPVPTRFAPETRFEVTPAAATPFRATQTSELERLKNRLTDQLVHAAARPELYVLYRRAANDAAALAWATPYPLLLFPALLEERAVVARQQLERQESVWLRSQPSAGAAT